MEQKLKIAIFTDNYLPGVGGTENATMNLASELTRLGHEVVVVASHYKNEDDSKSNFKIIRKKSIKVDANNYYALPHGNSKLFKQLDEFKPDIIHCQTQASMLSIALKYAKKHNLPCISTIHTKFSYAYQSATKSKLITNFLLKKIGKKLKKANKVTAVSYGMGQEFKLYGYNGPFDVIKNGATFEKFENSQIQHLLYENFDIKPNENLLLFVGRITKVKNIDFIFECLEILKSKGVSFKMLFVGTGEDLNYFKELAKKKTLENDVMFLGKITDKKLLSSIYLNSSLYLFPSIFDNDSLTIIEASLYSLPTIAIENTDSSERITNNHNGFIIKNSPKDMAEKVEYLLNNKDIIASVGENASKEIPKTWTQATNEYLNIYYDELKKKNNN